MDRSKVVEDILSLVDSNPMNDVDIKDILSKNCPETTDIFSGRQKCRGEIANILKMLKENDEIDYNDQLLHSISSTTAGQFNSNGFLIKSTYKRGLKLENKPIPAVHHQNTYITTHGHNSPVISNSPDSTVTIPIEDNDSKQIAREGLRINRKMLIWTIIIGVLTALLLILALK